MLYMHGFMNRFVLKREIIFGKCENLILLIKIYKNVVDFAIISLCSLILETCETKNYV